MIKSGSRVNERQYICTEQQEQNVLPVQVWPAEAPHSPALETGTLPLDFEGAAEDEVEDASLTEDPNKNPK